MNNNIYDQSRFHVGTYYETLVGWYICNLNNNIFIIRECPKYFFPIDYEY